MLVRRLGRAACEHVLSVLAEEAVEASKREGLTPQRRPDVNVRTILGMVSVSSPYLRHPTSGATARPVKDRLGLVGGMKTTAVERALTDFGAEESFALASQRFEEHYGQEVGRTSVMRVVESVAREAETYLTERLFEARQAFDQPLAVRPGVDCLVVELDGSMIRTGTLVPDPEGGTTDVRQLPARRRDEAWREVRVGFARAVGSLDRTYIARMDKYEPVVSQLFDAAVDRGLSERSEVYAVADGGHGLRDELEAQFVDLNFVLDRMHLKSHLFETAEAMRLDQGDRARWVDAAMTLIDAGHIDDVVEQLRRYTGQGDQRVARLTGYLERFRDAVDYAAAHERGVPLGSGEVESAHRYIPQKRMKIPGACWSPRTVNPMLALRVVRANGWWNDFWSRRTARQRAA